MRKASHTKAEPTLAQRIKEGSLPPSVQAKLTSLSKELNMPEEHLAELCVMMWRTYGSKA